VKVFFIKSTHVDRSHVHNHVIFNSVSYKDNKKYQAYNDYKQLASISDKLCQEYGLSVIQEPKKKGKSYTEYNAHKEGKSWKSKLRQKVDECVLKAMDWDDFLKLMQVDYEIKQGKYISFRARGQERYTRMKTLGAYYTEEKIKARITAVSQVVYAPVNSGGKRAKPDTNIRQIIDIKSNQKAQSSAGFKHWAEMNNLKMAAQTLLYVEENRLQDPAVFYAKYNDVKGKNTHALTRIREVEKRIKVIDEQIKAIDNYRKYKPVVDGLKSVAFKDNYEREHETEFILFNAAKQSLKVHFEGGGKLPLIKDLRAEMNALYTEKNSLYSEFYSSKDELKELSAVKKNMESYFNFAEHETDKSQEREAVAKSKNKDGLE